ncbi:unnamed protein product [Clonostachys rhizophaga]|uniref:DUF2828 domain-containing protein n=1 Tax=Clonostachys rhizophaga TaxID=160324 RepID=A0A9N9YEC0_9HYPO|nr:unnamed protein product [Clonostachys rhizophaga]
MASSSDADQEPWFLKSSVPVWLPYHEALTMPNDKFNSFIRSELDGNAIVVPPSELGPPPGHDLTDATSTSGTHVTPPSTTADIREAVDRMEVDGKPDSTEPTTSETAAGAEEHPWRAALLKNLTPPAPPNLENKVFTANGDLAHASTTDACVDLFYELEDSVSGPRLRDLLAASWNQDALLTLKIIFNARSIHLGKSSRNTFYGCAGWLFMHHPLTLIENLKWLSRPVIQKKAKKETDGEDDEMVVVEAEKDPSRPETYDVKHGVAHGYWKDIINILALAANNQLNVLADPKNILNSKNPGIYNGKSIKIVRRRAKLNKRKGEPADKTTVSGSNDKNESDDAVPSSDYKVLRRAKRLGRNQNATRAFNEDLQYRVLHLAVARLFAEQLEKDLAALRGDDYQAKRTISLCGKWAPSHDRFHDKHTFIVSSIAEIMHPRESFDNFLSPSDDRDTYLRYAREAYRKDISALRKHLEIVERDLSAGTFEKIKYDRVPSVAMQNYTKIFVQKDLRRFEEYITRVAEGKANISGAILLPSTMVAAARRAPRQTPGHFDPLTISAKQFVDLKIREMQTKVDDGQWNTLVKRIKDSGVLASSIAVCDVSGSMQWPQQTDGTTPMDSAIGLSLLIAEVTEPPYGGAFITFSSKPRVEKVDLSKPLSEKVAQLERANWSMNTDFEAVFLKLLLPMAREHNLKQEDMVKQVFVFSDMQFDEASSKSHRWTTSYERVSKAYKESGYEVPELVFWNLAGGSHSGQAPKPVTTEDEGTCLMSGYSQGLLKAFLEKGGFEDDEEEEQEEVVVVTRDEGGDVTTETVKRKKNPISMVKKAVSHEAYKMLRVVD